MIHLHVHNEFSLLDGVGSGGDYAKKAKELKMPAIALTNHGNVDGCIRFQNYCKKENVHPIFGFEGYIVEDITKKEKGEKRKHILIIAKNMVGWKNILNMITISNIEGFYYRPRIDSKLLLKHLDGLIISSACTSTFLNDEWGIDLLIELKKRKFKDFFFEIMPLQLESQKRVNKKILRLSKKYKYKIIATNDCHYVNKEDSECQEVLLAIQTKKKWNDPNRWRFDVDDLYVKSRSEMINSFKKQGIVDRKDVVAAVNNTELIYDLVKDFTIPEIKVELPKVPGYGDYDDDKFLRKLCLKGFKKKIKDKVDDEKLYKDRFEEEYKTITKQGFSCYFLIVWELIDWCKKNDILVGPGRGSSGGSLMCYLLNITEVDPIKHNLIFARFISPARIDFPDIDIDFEDNKRNLVRKHLEDLYGKDNVAGVSTFTTMKGRGALRDVSRVFNVPLLDVDKAAKSIVVRCLDGDSLIYTIDGPKKIKHLIDKNNFRVSCHGMNKRETRIVDSVYENVETEMFEVELESGKKIICSNEHKFWVDYKYKYNGEIKRKVGWKKLKNIDIENDKILTYDFDDVYSYCKFCNKIIYNKKKNKRIFCSLSCITKYKNKFNNPMKNFKSRKRNSEAQIKRLKNNPDKHPFRIINKNKKNNIKNKFFYLEKQFYNSIQIIFNKDEVKKNYRIKQIDGNYYWWIDTAVVDKKIAFELDGSQHKKILKIKNRDKQKDFELSNQGWKIIRINKKDFELSDNKVHFLIGVIKNEI
jgi:very-short-patch-repair endonuclease